MNTKKLSIGIWLAYLFFNIGCQQSAVKNTGDETTPVLAPEEELKSFALEQDLEIRLVASEPLVQDPVVIQFDEQGRIWVVEMRGFMPDIDGKGEKDRVGRINILLDRDDDGMMDSSIIYLDSLVLPRAIIKPIKYNKEKDLTLIEVIPLTGRQHQIRVHLHSIGYTILGDPIYGIDDVNAENYLNKTLSLDDRFKVTGSSRLWLHANYLEFTYKNITYKIYSKNQDLKNEFF